MNYLTPFLTFADSLYGLGIRDKIEVKVPTELWRKLSREANNMAQFPEKEDHLPGTIALLSVLYISEQD